MSDMDKLVVGFTRTGRPILQISGGDGEGEGGGEGSAAGEGGSGEGSEGGEGGSGKETDWQAEATKWKALARKHESQAKSNADAAKRLKDAEDADKSEIQKATERATAAEGKAQEAELRALRYEVGHEKGLTPAQAKRLVGTTREELEADADELLESFKPADGEKDKGGPRTKPTAKLRGGGSPDESPTEMDPRKLAEMIPRGPR